MKLSNFNLLDGNTEERDFLRFIEEFNATDANYPKDKTVADLFDEQVAKRGDETALIFRNEKISYRKLNEEVEKVAAYLLHNGVQKESIVALLFDKSLEMLYAILGVVKSGGVYLPMDPTHPEDRLNFILEDSAAKFILTHALHEEKVGKLAESTNQTLLTYSVDSEKNQQTSIFTKPTISVEDTLYIIYTSGSTGRPKGCRISHKNVVRLMVNDKHDFDFSDKDTWIMAHAYYFDFSVWEMYGSLLYGGQLVVPYSDEIKDVSKLHQLISNNKVSVLNQTPLAFNFFMDEELGKAEHKLDSHLRYVIFGGDKLDPAKLLKWSELYSLDKVKMINMYGITETTVHVTYYQITREDVNTPGVSPIGRPIPETKIYLLNDNLQQVPVGIVGEMYVGGTGVCKGYLNREELTSERFIKSPFNENEILYRTGDQARWTDDFKLDYLGRIDFQVKIRGYRIELGEIESVLNQCEGIRQAVVIAVEHNGENELIAYAVGENGLDVNNLRSSMLNSLPDYMIPAHFVQIDEIPLTSNGKLDKNSLPDPFKNSLSGMQNYIAPENDNEAILAEIWQEQLGLEQVGVEDNFFHIGGDSLKAIRVTAQINKRLNVAIRISDIFTHKTIRNIVNNLDEIGQESRNDFEVGMNKINQLKTYIVENSSDDLPQGYEDIYPLTTIEKGMIFSSMLRSEEPVYYDQFTYNLEIKNKDVFHKAFELMVQKHPIMRSKYFMNTFLEPTKVQMLTPTWTELPLDFEDISDLKREEQEKIINAYLMEDANERLQFEGDLLWHLKAFLVGDESFYLVWTVHHAMLDGWSENSFVAEFANLCARPDLMEIGELPALKSSYKDYTAIQLGRETSSHATEFWKNHLNGFTRNKLPFNLSGKRISNDNGMRKIQRSFAPETGKAVEELKNRLNLTPKTICLAAYAYLMHIIASEKDVVAGVVSNDRPEIEDADKILGCFLNTVPFRVDFEQIKTYRQLLEYFSDYLNNIRKFEINLVDIANAVGEKSNGNPLFDCIFNYTDFYVLEDIDHGNTNLKYADKKHSGFEFVQNNLMTNTLFDVEIDRTLGEYSIGIKYAPAYFRAEDVNYTIELYENILLAFTHLTEKTLDSSDLLTKEEKNNLLYEFNATVTPYSEQKLMHQLFEDQAVRTPDQIALTQHGKSISYRELDEKANRIAHFLKSKGAKSGDNIGIICERNFFLIEALFAILKVGGAYVPVDPSYPKDRQEYILSNSIANIILVDNDYAISENDPNKFVNISNLDFSQFSSDNLNSAKLSQDLAYTIYTSGSTGLPKGVMIAHHSAVNLIEWVNKEFNVGTNDRLLFITSICFDLSVYDIFGMLAAGGTIVIATQDEVRDPETLKNLMVEEKITFWDAVPTTMNYLVDMIETSDPAYRQNDLRLVFMSGDWIPVTLPDRIKEYFPNAKNISLGGATEGTVWSNFYPIQKVEPYQISIPYGKPMDNNFFYILDDNQKPVPRGVAGELFIGGVGVALGYANDEEKTNAAFFADPFSKLPNARMYKTGDLGRMMPGGNMEFLGRKDFQVKIRGFRVELGEIENQLQKHELVQRAIVLAKDDTNNSKYLCAYVVLKEELDNEELRSHLAKDLPDYMIPGIFIRIEKVPVTSNGKIDRKALPDPASYIQNKTIEMPQTELEENLAEIWKNILGLERIGRNENVFELGAHSLHAGAFVSRLHKNLNLSLNLRDLFTNPSIESQAKILDSKEQGSYSVIPNVAPAAHYELSHAQRRLWVIDQIRDGQSTEYNLPVSYKVGGNFNVTAFEKAIQTLVDRHEILRTSFNVVDGEPKQFINDNFNFSLDLVECKNEVLLNEMLQENAILSFDLSTAPLFRIKVFQLSTSEFVISFVMHHIISDGWSMGIMIKEIFRNYALHTKNETAEISALNIQYKDFSAWQNAILNTTSSESHKDYWRQKMNGEIPVLEFPTKGPRPAVLNNEAERFYSKINPELTRKIKDFCLEQGVSTFMFLQAAVKVLFHRYTGQNEIILGSPIAGREHAELSDQIGFYVNTLALKDKVNSDNTFTEFLSTVKETVLGAFEHQAYPYDKLVEDLNIPRSLNRNALFDIMLVMQNVDESKNKDTSFIEEVSAELQIEKLDSEEAQSKFDMTLNFFEANEIALNLEYRSELYEADFIATLWNHLENVISTVIENKYVKIREIDLLSPQEKAVLESFNTTSFDFPKDKNVIQLFEENAKSISDKDALVFDGGSVSYAELNRKAEKIAVLLQEQNLGKGDVVACLLPKSPELIASILGIWKSGGIYLPINSSYPKERIEFVLSDSSAKAIITNAENSFGLPVIQTGSVTEKTYEKQEISPEDTAYIIYTSGSTGTPKGVMVSHSNAVSMAIGHTKAYDINTESRVLLFASTAFDASIGEILPALINKASLAICSDKVIQEVNLFYDFVNKHKATIAWLTPSYINLLDEAKLSSLKSILTVGEAAIVRDVKRFSQVMNVYNGYGPTETTVLATTFKAQQGKDYTSFPIGYPVPNAKLYVVDKNGNLQAIGVPGELWIGGSGVSQGYLNHPELTTEKFIDNPFGDGKLYRSGDLVKWSKEGYLEYLGRMDHQVKIRGYRIETGEIENAIRNVSGVVNSVVLVKEMNGDKTLISYYVSNPEVDSTEIKAEISKFLPEFMVPSHFIKLEEIPMNSNGKVDKSKLPEVQAVSKEIVLPENELEEQLLKIWKEVLRIEGIGVTDKFFELGGNSLKAIQVINRVREEVGVELTVKDLFGKDTIKELADVALEKQLDDMDDDFLLEMLND